MRNEELNAEELDRLPLILVIKFDTAKGCASLKSFADVVRT